MCRKREFLNIFTNLPMPASQRVRWCCEAAGVRPSAVYSWCANNERQPSAQAMMLIRAELEMAKNGHR